MNRLALAAVVAGLALSSGLSSQGRGRFGGEMGSAPLVPELVHPAGASRNGGGSYRSPGVEGAQFELVAGQSATALEAHYRKQLVTAGWKLVSTGGDPQIVYSRFTIPAAGGARAGTLMVTAIESGHLWVTLRVTQSMPVPAPRPPRPDAEMMDWMLRQLPRPDAAEPPEVASAMPGTFPKELLPPGFKRSRTLSGGTRVTVAGTVSGLKPSDLAAYFAALRKAGWADHLRSWMTANFVIADFCRDDLRASIAFSVEPKRAVLAGVIVDKPPYLRCDLRVKQPHGVSAPVVAIPAGWSPAHQDGGGGGQQSRAGMRLTTSTPLAAVAAEIESQIAASGYKVTARTGDPDQSIIRFESTQSSPGSAIVLLSVTKLPWSQQIDVRHEVIVVSTSNR